MKFFYKNILLLSVVSISNSCSNEKKILYKDNFENYQLNKPPNKPWIISGEGKVVIDTLKSYSGGKGVHFISGEGYKNRSFISISGIIPKYLESYYGSMKMYVEEASPNGIHWTMIQTSGKTQKGFQAEVRYGGQHYKKLMANYDTKDIKTDCWHHTKFKIPEKQWFSIKWYMDRENNNMKLWINNKLVHELNTNDKEKGCLNDGNNNEWTFPYFEKISLGWVDYQQKGGTRNIWIDDLIIYH